MEVLSCLLLANGPLEKFIQMLQSGPMQPVLWIRMDPHHFGNPDPDPHPHQIKNQDADPHQSDKLDPDTDPHQFAKQAKMYGI